MFAQSHGHRFWCGRYTDHSKKTENWIEKIHYGFVIYNNNVFNMDLCMWEALDHSLAHSHQCKLRITTYIYYEFKLWATCNYYYEIIRMEMRYTITHSCAPAGWRDGWYTSKRERIRSRACEYFNGTSTAHFRGGAKNHLLFCIMHAEAHGTIGFVLHGFGFVIHRIV